MTSENRVNIIARDGRCKAIVKRSTFWSSIGHVTTREAANTFVRARRTELPKATHHAFAWRVGDPVSWEESSDDGEPTGTAGLPVMNVLRNANLTDVAIVVSRIFGGTKLGFGGLARAYGRCAADLVMKAGIIDARDHEQRTRKETR